jgi:hypothetical protein
MALALQGVWYRRFGAQSEQRWRDARFHLRTSGSELGALAMGRTCQGRYTAQRWPSLREPNKGGGCGKDTPGKVLYTFPSSPRRRSLNLQPDISCVPKSAP